jgi:hypothetical protein
MLVLGVCIVLGVRIAFALPACAVVRQCFGLWKQVFQKIEAGVIYVRHSLLQQIFEIFIWVKIICLCGLCQRVDNGAGFSSAYGVDHHPVLLAYAEWTDIFRWSAFEVILYVVQLIDLVQRFYCQRDIFLFSCSSFGRSFYLAELPPGMSPATTYLYLSR